MTLLFSFKCDKLHLKDSHTFSSENLIIQTQFHKSWDTVQIVNKNRMQ